MAKPTLRQEIDELRAQVNQLRLEHDANDQTDSKSESEPSSEEISDEPAGSNFEAQAKELLELLEQDLKTTNPLTLLTVFVLGLLVGRFLPR